MPELLPYLLVPVAALLFLNLRLSRRVRYPHDLLRAENRRGVASFLFRSFRTYYDVLLDGALAVAVAFALAPPRGARPAAVVIDGSRAMTAGFGAERPLEKALQRILTDPSLKGADPYLLAFEPGTGATRLAPLQALLAGADAAEAARRLRDTFTFFAPAYDRLADLRRRGYGDITLLTDQPRVKPEGFRVLALGATVPFAAYPSGVRFDRASGSWIVALVEAGPYVTLGVSVLDRAEGRFVRLPPERYALEQGMAGRVVRFKAPGLYLLTLRGPLGQDDIDLPLLLGKPRVRATAAGSFSERMLSVFTDLERGSDLVLSDLGVRAPGGTRRTITARVPQDGEYVLDPAAAGGALIALGQAPGVDLALGPSSLANEDLVRVFDALLDTRERPFRTAPSGRSLTPAGTAFLEREGAPLLPPPSQFFETRPSQRLALPPPATRRWPWVLLLAGLAGLKLAAWSRLSGKPLLGRDQAIAPGPIIR